jgi:hypothetical protein
VLTREVHEDLDWVYMARRAGLGKQCGYEEYFTKKCIAVIACIT